MPEESKETKLPKEKVEYYTVKPNLKQIYGKKVNKDTCFIEKTDDGIVTQEFKDLTLTTHVKKSTEAGEYKIEEESTMKITVPDGAILIWDEEQGFSIPAYQMCSLDDIINEAKEIKEIYK